MSRNALYSDPAFALRSGARLGQAGLLVLIAPAFMTALDAFIVIVAAPSIQRQLGVSDAGVQLVVAGYVVAYASCLIAGGRLGDMHGRRRLLAIGSGLFSVFSLACAMAPDQWVLILARSLEGGSAALMYPQMLALIRVHSRTDRDLAQAMAAWGVALGLASAAAPVLGGLLIQADVGGLGWRVVFLVNVPLGIAVAGLAGLVPESRSGAAADLDVVGTVMLVVGLFALVLPLTIGRELGWPLWIWPLMAGSAPLGGLYLVHERRLARAGRPPLVALDLLLAPGFAIGMVTTLALYGGQLSLWVLVSVYVQRGLRLSPLAAGLAMAPVALGFAAASTITPRLAGGRVAQTSALGSVAVAAGATGLGTLALVGGDWSRGVVLPALLILTGAGFGAAIPSLAAAVLRVVPRGHEGVASAALVTAQQAAAALGVALGGAAFFGLLRAGVPYGWSFGAALILNVALFLTAAVLAWCLGRAS